jgi:hypothetical protein
MPQVCTICTHQDGHQINLALVRGQLSNRRIAAQFKVAETSLRRHKDDHLPDILKRGFEAQQTEQALDVTRELARCISVTNRMLDACEEWLSDPDEPDRYTLAPRADEIDIVFEVPNGDGKLHRKRESLNIILRRIEQNSPCTIHSWESKRADPRKLLLDSVAQLRPLAELLARLEGKIRDGQQINILINPQWVQVRTALLEALAPYPQARHAVASRLALLEADANGSS